MKSMSLTMHLTKTWPGALQNRPNIYIYEQKKTSKNISDELLVEIQEKRSTKDLENLANGVCKGIC